MVTLSDRLVEHFGLTLLPASHPGHDATDSDGRLVQVKLTAGNSISMFADCDRLIVLHRVAGAGRDRLRRPRRTGVGGGE
jgi:hypothetical protein